jgi:hypothetical protein
MEVIVNGVASRDFFGFKITHEDRDGLIIRSLRRFLLDNPEPKEISASWCVT